MKEKYNRNPSPKVLKDIQEATKHIPQLQGQLFKATGTTQVPTCKFNPQSTKFTNVDWAETPKESVFNFV